MDDYFSSGSDDFRGYVWKIPDTAEITDRRQKVSLDNWSAHDSSYDIGMVLFAPMLHTRLMSICTPGFSEGLWEPRYVPVELSIPVFRLSGT